VPGRTARGGERRPAKRLTVIARQVAVTVQFCNTWATASILAEGRPELSSPQPIKFTDGAAYERFMAPWSRSAGSIFLDWLAPGPGLNWIDVGCGNGAFTELILAKAAPSSVCAIDPSEAQIAAARQRISAKQVELSVGDAMTLPYDDARFDVSAMALVLFFVPDANKGAAEMVRVTRPGGMVASYTWDVLRGGTPTQPLWEELQALGKQVVRPPSSDVSRFEVLKALWADLGIRDVETRELVVERKFADFDDYWLSMVVSSPRSVVQALSDAENAELKRRLQARLPASASGEITVHSWATAIKGRKAA
jgi:SAM-dependent methyltransferase